MEKQTDRQTDIASSSNGTIPQLPQGRGQSAGGPYHIHTHNNQDTACTHSSQPQQGQQLCWVSSASSHAARGGLLLTVSGNCVARVSTPLSAQMEAPPSVFTLSVYFFPHVLKNSTLPLKVKNYQPTFVCLLVWLAVCQTVFDAVSLSVCPDVSISAPLPLYSIVSCLHNCFSVLLFVCQSAYLLVRLYVSTVQAQTFHLLHKLQLLLI